MSNTTTVSGNELTAKKTLHAPRELVWEVWTKPEHIVHWWGPVGFTTTSGKMEVQPGSSWDFTMHGPDGRDYPNRIIFLEVKKPELLIYKHAGDDDTEPVNFHVTVSFEAAGNDTHLTMRSTFNSAEELDRLNRVYGIIQGETDTVNRLEEYLVEIKTGYQKSMTVDATVSDIFLALTNKLSDWWTTGLEGNATQTGDKFTVRFDATFKTFEVEELIPGKKIIWKCADTLIDIAAFENKKEWLGTKIVWEIASKQGSTQLKMTHYGLTPALECYPVCENGWSSFLASLQQLLLTGKGTPFTHQALKSAT